MIVKEIYSEGKSKFGDHFPDDEENEEKIGGNVKGWKVLVAIKINLT